MHGPDALRQASYNFESYLPSLEIDLQDIPIFDAGDVEEAGTADDLRSIMKLELEHFFSEVEFSSCFPIFLGGEHSLTPMVLDFINPKAQELDSAIGVVYLDAHMDLRNEYLGNHFSHACAARRAGEIVGFDRLASFGVRSWSREEAEFLRSLEESNSFSFYDPNTINNHGPYESGENALAHLRDNGCNKIYLSIDMDVFDPSIAPGVGNPEPGGLGYTDVLDIIEPMASFLCGMDLVETNPVYDQGITAQLGAKVIRDIIGMHFDSFT